MAVQISGNDITVPRDGSFTRNVTIGGTLTYEDVTNIDSVGLVTARNGIEIGARPGVAASISVDGNMIVSGISTFAGDVQTQGDVSIVDAIYHSGDTNTKIRFPSADTFTVETGGSERLRVDSSGNVQIPADTVKLQIGASQDLYLWHNGSTGNSNISNVTGDLYIQGNNGSGTAVNQIAVKSNAAVELNHQGSKRFETTSSGVSFANGADATTSKLLLALGNASSKEATIQGISDSTNEKGIEFKTYSFAAKTPLTLTHDGHLKVPDNSKLKIGTGDDLQIYHDGTDSRIQNTTGKLYLKDDYITFVRQADDTVSFQVYEGGSTDLYHNHNLKLQTTSTGVSVTGNVTLAANGNALDFQNQTIESTSNYNRTVTAEKIDYYEEGYLDPTAISAGLTWDTSSNRQLRYVRIGHFVSVSGFLILSSRTSNSNAIQIAMPYQSAPNSSGYYTRGVGAVMMQYITLDSGYDSIVSYVGGGENYMRFFQIRHDGSGWTELKNSNLGGNNNTQIYFSINYMVA